MTERVNGVYTDKEVQRLLKVSRWTLYKWRRDGKVAYIRFTDNSFRYPKEEIERVLREGLK